MSSSNRTRFASLLAAGAITSVVFPSYAQEASPAASENTVEPEELTLDETPERKEPPKAEPAPSVSTSAPARAAQIEAPATRAESPEDTDAASEERMSERNKKREKGETTGVGVFANPAGVLLRFYGLELDLSPARAASINFNGVYYDKTAGAVSTTAYGIDMGVQFFLSGNEQMAGAYLYPRVSYAKAKATAHVTTSTMSSSSPYYSYSTNTTQTAEASLYGLGATVGYQWNWHPIALRLGGGFVYYTTEIGGASSGSSSVSIAMKGTSLLLDLALGLCG